VTADEGVRVTATVENLTERRREVIRLTDERMALAPVEGALGLVMDDLTEDSLRLAAPVPLRDGRPDRAGVIALMCVLTDTAAGLAGGAVRCWHVRTVRLPGLLANPREQIHGGVVVALAELAQRDVREAATSPGAAAPRLLSMAVDYLRPADCDGTPLACRSEYTRHGKRFSTLRTELVRPDGRLAAIGTGLWSAVE
jgi:uncharacterized protein (TIGR00369 family)